MKPRFENKSFLVTGAAQGIGAAVTRLLVAQGAFVHVVDVKGDALQALAAELNQRERAVEPRRVDIRVPSEVEAVVAVADEARPLDGVVNAAGILVPAAFEAATPESWKETFDVNTSGVFFVSQAAARRMLPRRSGVIVTVASNAANTPRVGMAAYCASKAAVTMLTRCMGLELARHGIRCNTVSPGSTDTPMLRVLTGDSAESHRRLIEGDPGRYRVGIPLGRVAEPDDIARGVAFLLSDEARHITMHDLVVDGGATLG
ncbi:2,3-dihydro-2,3-dihydroxybenzoate dehydrogenase [Sorangium sp. So ce302]|uniref:2,3-dihydro-2,3-dihydroxybenzoate dehydrogenase n=1 Tax=unclassified Sorangium TaxID=2621164 RepID=UPI003F5E6680